MSTIFAAAVGAAGALPLGYHGRTLGALYLCVATLVVRSQAPASDAPVAADKNMVHGRRSFGAKRELQCTVLCQAAVVDADFLGNY